MVGQITGKMFDHPIEKDSVSDLSDPGSCQIGPVRQVAGPENAAIQNLACTAPDIILYEDPEKVLWVKSDEELTGQTCPSRGI